MAGKQLLDMRYRIITSAAASSSSASSAAAIVQRRAVGTHGAGGIPPTE